MEVIVVDNNSTDSTAKIAKGFRELLHVRVLLEKKKGRGAARKSGFEAAKGEIIFSTDADTMVPSDWVSSILKEFDKDARVVAVTGMTKIVDCDAMTNFFFNAIMPLHMKAYRLLSGYCVLSGFNFAIKRTAYKKAGGFNAVTDAYEDVDLSKKVHKSNLGTVRLIEEAPVIFSGRRFKRGLVRGYMDYATTFTVKFFSGKDRVLLRVVDNKGKPVDDTGALAPALSKLFGDILHKMESEVLPKIPFAKNLLKPQKGKRKKK